MSFARRWFLGSAAALPAAAALRMTLPPAARSLAAALDSVRLFDTHEHLTPEKERLSQPLDFFGLAGHYAISDVISAGLAGEDLATVRDLSAPVEKRWRAFEPYWKAARLTGYGQALRVAVADVYGVEDISLRTVPKINDAIREQSRPGFYDRVLKEKARIDWCLVDANWNEKPQRLTPDYFLLAQKFDGFVTPSSLKDVARLEGVSGMSIQSLADLRKALERTFDDARKAGMVAVKSTLAYRRELLYEEVPEADAAADFKRMIEGGVEMPKGFRSQKHRPLKRLEDHMFHAVVRLAEAHGFPFQIHTGLLAGNSCFIENTRPGLLQNLFHLYPRVRFDLFHIGYPYQEELGVLAKLFPNVWADFCWAHIISPPAARRTLDDYLETVPANKILAFGGDYRMPELSYAHAEIARNNVARVLGGKLEAGLLREDQAFELGRMLLRDNALALFKPSGSASVARL